MERDTCGNRNHKIWKMINNNNCANQHWCGSQQPVTWRLTTSGDATKSGKAATAANNSWAQAILGSLYGFAANNNARSETSPADFFWLLCDKSWKDCTSQLHTRERREQRQQNHANNHPRPPFLASSHERNAMRQARLIPWAYVAQLPVWMPIYRPSLSRMHGTGSYWAGQTSWLLAYAALQDNSAFEINTFTFQEQADMPAPQGKLELACILHIPKPQASDIPLTVITQRLFRCCLYLGRCWLLYPGTWKQQSLSAVGWKNCFLCNTRNGHPVSLGSLGEMMKPLSNC